MDIVTAVCVHLEEVGITGALAHRRFQDPEPGGSVIVVTSESTWAAGPTSAEFPLLKVLTYSAPSDGQANAEEVGHQVTRDIRRALHVMDGHAHTWGDCRVIGSQHVGSSLAPAEGHEDWRVRVLTFEVETA